MEQIIKDLVVSAEVSAESVGASRHLAMASVVRQLPVFEMRSLLVERSRQVTNCATGAAVASERCAAISEIPQAAMSAFRTPSIFTREK